MINTAGRAFLEFMPVNDAIGVGGRHRTRTCDPCGVIAVLYQLS